MKRFIAGLILTVMLLFSGMAMAEDVWLICDIAVPTDNVEFVIITINSIDQEPIPYSEELYHGRLVCKLDNLSLRPDGEYTITARFVNKWGAGAPSDPLSFTKSVPDAPANVTIE